MISPLATFRALMLAALWSMVWTGHLTVHLTALLRCHRLEIFWGWIVDTKKKKKLSNIDALFERLLDDGFVL